MLGARLAALWTLPLARAGLFGLGYLLCAELGHALSLSTPERTLAGLWPAAGLLLSALVLAGYRSWLALLLAACAANLVSDVLLHQVSLPVSLGFCAANCGEACLGAWLLRRFVDPPLTLTRVDNVLALACWAALISPVVGATIGAGVVWLAFDASYLLPWQTWWAAHAIGVLLIAPVVLAWAAEGGNLVDVPIRRLVECAALFAGLILMAEGVYGEWFSPLWRVPILVLPFLLWAGLQFGLRGASTAMLLVAIVGMWHTIHGQGPYAALLPDPAMRLLRTQIILFATSLTVLVLAAIVAERRQAEAQRTKLIGDLEQALAEIRTLQGLIPICAWCRKLRDDQGSWQRLEDYLRVHTDATLTHGICPECLKQQTAAVEAGDAGPQA